MFIVAQSHKNIAVSEKTTSFRRRQQNNSQPATINISCLRDEDCCSAFISFSPEPAGLPTNKRSRWQGSSRRQDS